MTKSLLNMKTEINKKSVSFSESPFGSVLITFKNKGISSLVFIQANKIPSDARKIGWKTIGKRKLALEGTAFQMKVWRELSKIPAGTLVTYGELAKRIKMPTAVRAVASAVGRNPIAYFVPCHRVVPASGGHGKYHWGAKRKSAMIKAEMKSL
jgi:AraC family transcriptional regulator of adaptative response/methylated-DNA-[protein]-cysteine methyltransferase